MRWIAGVTETSRDAAFCAHAVLGNELMEVPNALDDERFHDNPLVIGDPHIRFYAGMPLRLKNGICIGTLCVIDRVPRVLSDLQRRSCTSSLWQSLLHCKTAGLRSKYKSCQNRTVGSTNLHQH